VLCLYRVQVIINNTPPKAYGSLHSPTTLTPSIVYVYVVLPLVPIAYKSWFFAVRCVSFLVQTHFTSQSHLSIVDVVHSLRCTFTTIIDAVRVPPLHYPWNSAFCFRLFATLRAFAASCSYGVLRTVLFPKRKSTKEKGKNKKNMLVKINR
jgi:hypothetical protein